MQSASAEYRRASEAFECTHQSTDDSSTDDSSTDDSAIGEHLRLTMLEGQQRVSFERCS
jgi:hypothetical protein